MKLPPLALNDAPGVKDEIDAAVAQPPDSGHRQKAHAAVVSGKAGEIGERQAETGDDPARWTARVAVGAL